MNVITMNCVFTNSSYIIILPVPNFQDTYNILQPQRVHMLYVPFIYIYVICVNLFGSSPQSRFGHTFFLGAENSHQDIKLSSLPRPSFLPPEFWEVWSFTTPVGVGVGSLKRSTNVRTAFISICFWSQRTLYSNIWRMTLDMFVSSGNGKDQFCLTYPKKGACCSSIPRRIRLMLQDSRGV